jgi:hypothetical protein
VTRPPGGAALALEPAQASTIEHELRRTLEADRPLLRSVLRHYRIPLEDAEDLIQDTLVLALMKWPQIRSLGPWLYGTLRHRCIGYWRKRRAAAAVEAHLTAEFAAHLCPAPPAGQRHRERRLLGVLGAQDDPARDLRAPPGGRRRPPVPTPATPLTNAYLSAPRRPGPPGRPGRPGRWHHCFSEVLA